MYFLTYGVPLIGTAILIVLIAKVVFRGAWWGWLLAAAGVIAASCVPWWLDRQELQREVAAFAPDEIIPDTLTLAPGALWHIEEGNHAGVTCSWECDFGDFPFVTKVDSGGVEYALQLGSSGQPIDRHNLWDGLYDVTRAPGQDFPYQYAYIGLSIYRDYGVPQSGDYRKPHWPASGKGVHMLVVLPADGILDFATADVLYRRHNVQRDMAQPFFWGQATQTVQYPSTKMIFDDLHAVATR